MTDTPVLNPLTTPHSAPEELFAVGPIRATAAGSSGSMALGSWSHDGVDETGETVAPGALAVLLDDVVGQAVLSALPADVWTVTTELSITFPRPLPAEGAVRAEGRLLHADPSGGAAEGRAVHESGAVVATATIWNQAVPGHPPVRDPATGGAERRRLGLAAALGTAEEPDGTLLVEDSPWIDNAKGATHGGVLACLAEMCGRRAATVAAVPGRPWLTSSLHIAYLRPSAGSLRVLPEVVHAGRSLASVRTRVVATTGKTVAEAAVLLRRRATPADEV